MTVKHDASGSSVVCLTLTTVPATFQRDFAFAERPALLLDAASHHPAWRRCLDAFGSMALLRRLVASSEAAAPHALSASHAVLAGCDLDACAAPELTSNVAWSCERSDMFEVEVPSPGTVSTALELLAMDGCGTADASSSSVADTAAATSLYCKVPLGDCAALLDFLNLPSFVESLTADPNRSMTTDTATPSPLLTVASHPMLLAPGRYFAWLYVGERGSASSTHVDVMASDAWLFTTCGSKEWIVVHPHDRHLIVDPQRPDVHANLFAIDHVRFPFAKYARTQRFIQPAGAAVFVPGDVPHAVRNLEPTISITFNYLTPDCPHQRASAVTATCFPQAFASTAKWLRFMQVAGLAGVDEETDCAAVAVDVHVVADAEEQRGSSYLQSSSSFRVYTTGWPAQLELRNRDALLTDFLFRTSGAMSAIQHAIVAAVSPSGPCADGDAASLSLAKKKSTLALPAVGYSAILPNHVALYFRAPTAPRSGLAAAEEEPAADVQPSISSALTAALGQSEKAERAPWAPPAANMSNTSQVRTQWDWLPIPSAESSDSSTTASGVQDKARDYPFIQHRFGLVDTHFGPLPAFPPLSAVLGIGGWWRGCGGFGGDQQRSHGVVASTPLSALVKKAFARPESQGCQWHYARFPWMHHPAPVTIAVHDAKDATPWRCRTQLFYSSPRLDGPVSLYPLVADGTLLPRAPLSSGVVAGNTGQQEGAGSSSPPRALFHPSFVRLRWDVDNLIAAVSGLRRRALMGRAQTSPPATATALNAVYEPFVLDFGAELMETLIQHAFLQGAAALADLEVAASRLGLQNFSAARCADCGLEKVLALLLHLDPRPGLCGFTYSHVFSAVREPDTVCLTGGAATALLRPITTASSATPPLLVADATAPTAWSGDVVAEGLRRVLLFAKGPISPSATGAAVAAAVDQVMPSTPSLSAAVDAWRDWLPPEVQAAVVSALSSDAELADATVQCEDEANSSARWLERLAAVAAAAASSAAPAEASSATVCQG